MVLSFLIIIIGLIMSGFFAGSETAVIACSRLRVKSEARSGSIRAGILEEWFNSPEFFFSIVLVGNSLANIACTAQATALAVRLFGNSGTLVAVIVMTPVILIFGEIIPKAVFLHYADNVSFNVAPVLKFFSYILFPLVKPVAMLGGLFSRISGQSEEAAGVISSREELLGLYMKGGEESDIARREQEIINKVFRFGVTRARDLMLPMHEVVSFSYDTPVSEVIETANRYPYSRYPLVSPESGRVVGVISLFDLLNVESGEKLTSLMHKPFYAGEDELAERVLVRIKSEPLHFAIVVGEEGVQKGILTLENIIESIVGDIASEYE
ncbi:MAG: CNNM domain-containing protein [Candidatus Krumholzibacteriales bacterium]